MSGELVHAGGGFKLNECWRCVPGGDEGSLIGVLRMLSMGGDSAPAGSSVSRIWSLTSGARILQFLVRRGDLAVAAVIVTVIALLVVPLPTPLLDGLIAMNLAASLSLLMLSMYAPSSLGLSTFPSLLL